MPGNPCVDESLDEKWEGLAAVGTWGLMVRTVTPYHPGMSMSCLLSVRAPKPFFSYISAPFTQVQNEECLAYHTIPSLKPLLRPSHDCQHTLIVLLERFRPPSPPQPLDSSHIVLGLEEHRRLT